MSRFKLGENRYDIGSLSIFNVIGASTDNKRGNRDLARNNIRAYIWPMVLELKLRKVGNSVGVVLPKEAMAKLNVQEGDTLALTDGPDGSMRVTPVTEGQAQFTKQMKAAEKIVRRYRKTLRELAK